MENNNQDRKKHHSHDDSCSDEDCNYKPNQMYPMCPFMQRNSCMMGQMDQSMGYRTERDDEDALERQHGGGGGHFGGGHFGDGHFDHDGHFGNYYPNYYYYLYPYYPYYPSYPPYQTLY